MNASAAMELELRPDMPARQAAKVILRARLRPLPRLLKAARRVRGRAGVERVHELRVAVRRAVAALDLFQELLDSRAHKRVTKRLQRLRRAAGAARDGDVARQALRARKADQGVSSQQRAAVDVVLEQLAADRRRARRRLARAIDKDPPGKLRRGVRKLIGGIGDQPAGSHSFVDAARAAVLGHLAEVRAAAAENLTRIEHVHALRICFKRQRYSMELLAPCLAQQQTAPLLERLTTVQERLGAINDADRLLMLLEASQARFQAATPRRRSGSDDRTDILAGMRSLVESARAERDLAHAQFLADWSHGELASLANDLEVVVRTEPRTVETHRHNGHAGPAPAGSVAPQNGATPDMDGDRQRLEHSPCEPRPARFAAIDVGTNSIRLIIAEAADDGSYRILDDEKEIARLGRGLEATGRMDSRAIQRAAEVVAGMKGIAEGYGAAELSVVGTAVVRAAANADELIAALRDRAGVQLQTISAEEEGKLAFISAANAFDLHDIPAAVVDIGGGSTEVVFAAAGVVDRIFTIPIGAVRLTERHGGAELAAGERFDELAQDVRRQLRIHIGKPPLTPQVVIGTGGTFVALASMVRHAQLGPAWGGDGLFAGGVQGHEVRRWELRHSLEYLRKCTPRERERVPGLSADRADIIVAGLVIVDGVMKLLGINSVRTHEGGIRDGLLLRMIGRGREAETGGGSVDGLARRDPMRSVLRFARACGYEHRHCDHVALLATQIFDRLAEEPSVMDPVLFTPRTRLLLQAAAIVHDVGYLVNYSRHHKHSYHLIAHADLPGLTTREVEIIANIARYHRRAEPSRDHANFARLSPDDRRIVTGLTAILRLAVGLDRTHMQRVSAVRTVIEGDQARFVVEAATEPSVDIWGAQRKSGLFERRFGLSTRFEWAGPPPEPVDEQIRLRQPIDRNVRP